MKCERCDKEFKHPSIGNVCNTFYNLMKWGELHITIEPKAYNESAMLCYTCIKEVIEKLSNALFEDEA